MATKELLYWGMALLAGCKHYLPYIQIRFLHCMLLILCVESSSAGPKTDQCSSKGGHGGDDWGSTKSEETIFVPSYDVKKVIGKMIL